MKEAETNARGIYIGAGQCFAMKGILAEATVMIAEHNRCFSPFLAFTLKQKMPLLTCSHGSQFLQTFANHASFLVVRRT